MVEAAYDRHWLGAGLGAHPLSGRTTALQYLTGYVVAHHHPIPAAVSLALIAGILAVGVTASLWASARDTAALRSPLEPPPGA